MRNLVLIIVIINIIAFTACEKLSTKKAVTAKVQVIDLTTGAGMPNRTVILKELKSTLPGVDVTVIDEATTDADGNCTFEFDAKKASKYKYEVEFIYGGNELFNPGQYNGYKYAQVDRKIIDINTDTAFKLDIVPAAVLKLNYYNLSPSNDSDNFYVTMKSNLLQVVFIFKGKSSKEAGDGLEFPYGYYTLKITGTSNGMPYEEERDIYLEHNKTLEYNLEL